MIRLYFDSNIYRILKANESPKVVELKEFLLKNLNINLIIIYSDGHIQDLQQDLTDKKYEDLDFMDQFVEDNFLTIKGDSNRIGSYLVRPREAYKSFNTQGETTLETFENLLNELNSDGDLKFVELFNKILKSQKVDLGVHRKTIIAQMLNGNSLQDIGITNSIEELDTLDFFKLLSNQIENFRKDHKIIRKMRRDSKNQIEQQTDLNINDPDFNEKFSQTSVGKTFLELLNSIKENWEASNYQYSKLEYFTVAYNVLNFMGVDNEKNRKVKFVNVTNDGTHAYYGSYTDYFISDDQGILNKSKFLYSLHNLETKVLTFQEFLESYKSTIMDSNYDVENYFALLLKELNDPIIIDKNEVVNIELIKSNPTIELYRTRNFFFNYFNRMQVSQIDNMIVVNLLRNKRRFDNFTFFREINSILESLVDLFGKDIDGNESFTEKDENSLATGKWLGRNWVFSDMAVIFNYNKEIDKYILTHYFRKTDDNKR